jgi:ABC-2 type transport system ATP-binding protein
VEALVQEDGVLAATPEADRLAQALERKGATVEPLADLQLRVAGMTSDQIGNIARADGITLSELTRVNRTLEDVFLQLTEGEQQDA